MVSTGNLQELRVNVSGVAICLLANSFTYTKVSINRNQVDLCIDAKVAASSWLGTLLEHI